jgi:hypothetical protein
MKIKLFFLVLMLGLVACKNDTGQTDYRDSEKLEVSGSAAPAQIPPPQMQETRLLTSRFWVFEHWVDADDPTDKSNRGRWYRFYEDGTYDGGQWTDHYDHGTWFLRKGSQYTELFIDSEINDLMDGKWEVQGIAGDETAMSWVKTREYGDKKAALCKMMAMLSMPTKEQFGMQ